MNNLDSIKAIIFDFNGVLIDDEPVHLEMLRRVIEEEGMIFAEGDYHEKYLGVDDRRCFIRAFNDHGRPEEANDPARIRELIDRKTGYYHEAVQSQDLLFPGVPEMLERLSASYPLAIASGALRQEIEGVLARGNLRDYFRLVVASEDVAESKPHPEGYLKALAGLCRVVEGLVPRECLVLEDSVAGVAAAKGAGMRCVAVTTSFPAEKLRQADWIVPRVTDWFRAP